MNPSSCVSLAKDLMASIYGYPSDDKFPMPLPDSEAGANAGSSQRRYLWTDSFAVLNYLAIADASATTEQDRTLFTTAAHRLIDVVFATLGCPRSSDPDDMMMDDARSPTGFVGLRIGKVRSTKVTDAGMELDGMYWHYLVPWMLALVRAGRVDEAAGVAASTFSRFWDGHAIRWKLSVDATPPPALRRAHLGSDTENALLVFELIESRHPQISLAQEIATLRGSLSTAKYQGRITSDPLSWGLDAIFNEYVAEPRRSERRHELAALQNAAIRASHMSLPFRLYGALLGAQISGLGQQQRMDELLQCGLRYHAPADATPDKDDPHSSINKVMLASALLARPPLVSPFAPCADDPKIDW